MPLRVMPAVAVLAVVMVAVTAKRYRQRLQPPNPQIRESSAASSHALAKRYVRSNPFNTYTDCPPS